MKIRNNKGKYQSVPPPKFFDGEIVTTSDKHFSHHKVIILIDPKWNTNQQGWVYGNEYCDVSKDGTAINSGGGFSFSWNECDFEHLSNPHHKLLAEKYYREEKLSRLKREVEKIEGELLKIGYSIGLLADKKLGLEQGND